MKRTGIISALLILIIAALLAGCGKSEQIADVRSILYIDDDFAGRRCIEIIFPAEVDEEKLETVLREALPSFEGDPSAYTLSAPVLTNAGNTQYTFEIKFSSQEDYQNKISSLIGRGATTALARPDNVLTRGIRFTEDFSVSDLIRWMTDSVSEAELYKELTYSYWNQADISGYFVTSEEEEMNIKELEGNPIESISIETVNTKDSRYERRFTFTVSNSVYEQLGDELRDYFLTLTDDRADFNGWSLSGDSQEYMVIYQGLDITALNEVTNKMLGVTDCEIFYGDKTNASTPLSEGLDFEEELDLSGFFSAGGADVPLTYTYSLPTETTRGDGQIYERGQWTAVGEWTGSIYSYSCRTNTVRLKIPDGIQYKIEGINYSLENLGDGTFIKNMDFLYSAENGQKGQSYAYNYFSARGANVSKLDSDGYLACRITLQGTPLELSVQSVELFGAGNYTDYDTAEPDYSLTIKTTFHDYINISYLLNAENQSVPIKYTVLSGSGEALRKLESASPSGNDSAAKPDESGNFSVTFTGGQADITYHGATPNSASVRNYVIFCIILLLVAGAVIVLLLKTDGLEVNKKRRRKDIDEPPIDEFAGFDEIFKGDKDDG